MREIKFRGLHEITRTGERVWSFYGIGSKPMLIGARWIVEDLQFTGLRDKNGKEIYEGDIIEYENGNAGYGRPRHEEISRDVVLSIFEHEKMSDGEIWWKDGTIIGSIYETPELLK